MSLSSDIAQERRVRAPVESIGVGTTRGMHALSDEVYGLVSSVTQRRGRRLQMVRRLSMDIRMY